MLENTREYTDGIYVNEQSQKQEAGQIIVVGLS